MPFITARVVSTIRPDAIAADAFAGPDQSVLCASIVQLEATIIGDDIENHTFVWEQTFGTPVTLINPNTLTPSFVNPQTTDIEFTFYLDKDTPYESADVVIITRRPTSPSRNLGGKSNTEIQGYTTPQSSEPLNKNLIAQNVRATTELTIGGYCNSDTIITWDRPANQYPKPSDYRGVRGAAYTYTGMYIETWNGTAWDNKVFVPATTNHYTATTGTQYRVSALWEYTSKFAQSKTIEVPHKTITRAGPESRPYGNAASTNIGGRGSQPQNLVITIQNPRKISKQQLVYAVNMGGRAQQFEDATIFRGYGGLKLADADSTVEATNIGGRASSDLIPSVTRSYGGTIG